METKLSAIVPFHKGKSFHHWEMGNHLTSFDDVTKAIFALKNPQNPGFT